MRKEKAIGPEKAMSVDLSKYLVPQKKRYAEVYSDISDNKYDSGWIEWIFPRLESQCDSKRSYGTGLNNEKEVQGFWKNRLLRENYLAMLRLLENRDKASYEALITERGRFKIKQSVELFVTVAEGEDKELLEQFLKDKYD